MQAQELGSPQGTGKLYRVRAEQGQELAVKETPWADWRHARTQLPHYLHPGLSCPQPPPQLLLETTPSVPPHQLVPFMQTHTASHMVPLQHPSYGWPCIGSRSLSPLVLDATLALRQPEVPGINAAGGIHRVCLIKLVGSKKFMHVLFSCFVAFKARVLLANSIERVCISSTDPNNGKCDFLQPIHHNKVPPQQNNSMFLWL